MQCYMSIISQIKKNKTKQKTKKQRASQLKRNFQEKAPDVVEAGSRDGEKGSLERRPLC